MGNIENTINKYKKELGILSDCKVLDDEECIQYIKNIPIPGASTDLVNYFHRVHGAFKADICRIAVLYFEGGYYFDVDLEVVEPYIVPKNVTFVTVQSAHNFFQAFIASTPYHPIIFNN